MERFHTYLHAHWGFTKTIALMTQHESFETDGTKWPNLRHVTEQEDSSYRAVRYAKRWTPDTKPYELHALYPLTQ